MRGIALGDFFRNLVGVSFRRLLEGGDNLREEVDQEPVVGRAHFFPAHHVDGGEPRDGNACRRDAQDCRNDAHEFLLVDLRGLEAEAHMQDDQVREKPAGGVECPAEIVVAGDVLRDSDGQEIHGGELVPAEAEYVVVREGKE